MLRLPPQCFSGDQCYGKAPPAGTAPLKSHVMERLLPGGAITQDMQSSLGSTPATGWPHLFSLHAVFQAGRHGVHAVDQEPDGWQISIGNFQDQSKWRSRHDGPSPQSTRLKLLCGACPCAPQRLSAADRHLYCRSCLADSHRCRGCMAPRPQRRPASRRCRDRCRRRDGPYSVAFLLVLSQSPFFGFIAPLGLEDEGEDDDQAPF